MNPKSLARKVFPKSVVRFLEEFYRNTRVFAIQLRYGFPGRGQKVISVTGTNGKTTTCNYINDILKSSGHSTALYTSAIIEMNGEREQNTTHRSLPLTKDLYKFLAQAKKNRVDFVIIEATSHGLDQHKMQGIPIEVAVFTNLAKEHLDYHKTMKNYAAAKARLFNDDMKPKYCVLNADDKYFDYYKDQSYGEVSSYGKNKEADYTIGKISHTNSSTSWEADVEGRQLELSISQAGTFNVYNAMAAFGAAKALGLDQDNLKQGVKSVGVVPGRMEKVDKGQNFSVIIDYAHMPDALEEVLNAAREMTNKNVICITGISGERDPARIEPMGKVAASNSDLLIVTDDEPYSDDPNELRAGVLKGARSTKAGAEIIEIPDRCDAMSHAFKIAKKDDVVIIAGMGSSATRVSKRAAEPWNEKQVVEDILEGKPNQDCENWREVYPPTVSR